MTVLSPAREERVLSPAEVVVGCVTENDPKYLGQALRLIRSIRWFGGALADARFLVCALEGIADGARKDLERYGAMVRVVRRFSSNGSSNRLRFLEEAWDECEVLLALDCDTLVVRDPLPLMRRERLQMKIEPLPTVTHDIFERLFSHYGLELPPRNHLTGLTRTPTIPYFNGGVIVVPSALARRIVPVWGAFNRELAERPELTFPCDRHLHQASLSLALAACPVPFEEAPMELNYQLNATHLEPPAGFRTLDPAILHYHDLVDDAGCLLPPPYPLARLRTEMFNQRVREERGRGARRPAPHLPAPIQPPSQLVVLGMHRAGHSVVTKVLLGMGLGAPHPCDATAGGEGSPVGLLDEAVLAACDASWCEADELDLDGLPEATRRRLGDRASDLSRGVDPSRCVVLADPRLCVLFPFWRRLLSEPICLLLHRDPLSIARSLQDRWGFPLHVGIALWELHLRSALASTAGLPRLLVSFHDLTTAPLPTVRWLRQELSRLGVEDGQLEEPRLERLVDPALDHHPRDRAPRQDFLTPPQLDLLESLESGAALALDPVPGLSAGARATLAAHRDAHARQRAVRTALDHRDGLIAEAEARDRRLRHDLNDGKGGLTFEQRERERFREAILQRDRLCAELHEAETTVATLDQLLAAVFASRSWRLGHFWSRLFHLVSGSARPGALDRWRRSRELRGVGGRPEGHGRAQRSEAGEAR